MLRFLAATLAVTLLGLAPAMAEAPSEDEMLQALMKGPTGIGILIAAGLGWEFGGLHKLACKAHPTRNAMICNFEYTVLIRGGSKRFSDIGEALFVKASDGWREVK